MENKVIEVLEYLSKELGIAIDWTSQNVMPQVMDLLERYRTFSIWHDSIWFCVWLVMSIICIYMFKKVFIAERTCDTTKEDNMWWYYSRYGSDTNPTTYSIVVLSFGIIGLLCGIIGIGVLINSLLRWIFVPEFQYLELLNSMIGA